MKSIVLFVFFIMAYSVFAQTVVLEKPEIPSPVKDVLFLSDINNYKGNVASVFKTKTAYTKDKSIRTFDTLKITPIKQNTALKKQLKAKKVIDKIGIDSIVKINNTTFELYKLDKEANYTWQKVTLKNNLITEYLDNGAVEYVHTTYSYDKFNRLNKIITENDYQVKEIVVGLSMKDGKIISKTTLSRNEKGTLVKETSYQYKNNLLVAISSREIQYKFQLTKETLQLLHTLLTSNNYIKEAVIKDSKILFRYNETQQLVNVNKTLYNWYWNKDKKEKYTQQYSLSYQPNKLIINTIVPAKKQYVYLFDAQENPIEINRFGFNNDKKVLEEKTVFKINYH